MNLTGSWIPLNNTNCIFDFPANKLNGIGGPLATISFKVPSAVLKPGVKNSLTFRFNTSDMVSIGYRVLAINALDANGNKLMAETRPVLTLSKVTYSASDIAAGAALWTNAPLKLSWTGAATQAKCSDCHAVDGADLKFFGFSDLVIGERARFHGLTSTEQRQIAAYVRNNSEQALGTPWDPPYQPGPGQSARPYSEWAAGAGLKWVLPRDSNSWDYVFTNGQVAFSYTNTLNVRDIPVSTPLPVWNDWLPRISPREYYPTNFQPTIDLYYRLLGETNMANINYLLHDWMVAWIVFSQANLPSRDTTNRDEQTINWSVARWMTTKTWEIMHSKRLEGRAQEWFSYPVDPHSWPIHPVFLSSPHFTLPKNGHILGDGTPLTWNYHTHQWYWTMMVLNDSNHRRQGAGPIDWPYLLPFSTVGSSYGSDSTAQTMIALVKSGESGTGDPYVWDDAFFGWAVTRSEYLDPYHGNMWAGYDPAVRDTIVRAYLAEYTSHIYQLGREYFRDVTHEIADGETDNSPVPPGAGPWIRQHAATMGIMRGDGFAPDVLDTMRSLATYLWPDADWSIY
jgi:hypothetical protein